MESKLPEKRRGTSTKPSAIDTAKAIERAKEVTQELDNYQKRVHQHSSFTSHKRHKALAASSATAEDEAKAAELKKQGIKPVQLPNTPYRPKEKSVYTKPDYVPFEDNEDWICLHKPMGNVIHRHKKALALRHNIITYDDQKHKAQFNRNIQWRSTPKELQPEIEKIIKCFWDVFDEKGVSRPIRGFAFNIDTCNIKPFSCKTPRYGAHKTRVINQLISALKGKEWIEDDTGPWGSTIVLVAKPNQEHVAWWEFVFRLCISYRKINGFNRSDTQPHDVTMRSAESEATSSSPWIWIVDTGR
jgi:hypothetical protein